MPKIAVLTGPKRIEIRDRNLLKPVLHEVIIAVEYAGVCGTDLALFTGNYPVHLPLILGHEFVGKVTSIGPEVGSHWMNQRVTAEINNTCLAYKKESLCQACQVGLINHCQKRTVTGIMGHDGAFAEEISVPVGCLHKIPQNLNSKTAVLIEPLAAALQTFEKISSKKSRAVAVIGPGRLGILIVFIAALQGHRVIAISRSGFKRERAIHFGALEACMPQEAQTSIKNFTKGLGVDIAVDATGNSEGLKLALQLVRPKGIIAVKTTCGQMAKDIDMTRIVVDELQIQGSRCGPFPPAIEILSKYQDQFESLITSVKSLDYASNALESALHEHKITFQIKVA